MTLKNIVTLKSRTVRRHSLCQFIHDLYITEIYRPGLAYLLVVDIIGLHHSSFFHTKRDDNIPTGTPLTGASNARGMKKSQFSTNIGLYLGTDAWLPLKANRKPNFRMVPVGLTLSDL